MTDQLLEGFKNNGNKQQIEEYRKLVKILRNAGKDAYKKLLRNIVSKKTTEYHQLIKDIDDSPNACIIVEFDDKILNLRNSAHIQFNLCESDHDLSFQLDKIYARIDPAKLEENKKIICANISKLLFVIRAVYAEFISTNPDFVKWIKDYISAECYKALCTQLSIDSENTTLYISKDYNTRLGIFVHINDIYGVD